METHHAPFLGKVDPEHGPGSAMVDPALAAIFSQITLSRFTEKVADLIPGHAFLHRFHLCVRQGRRCHHPGRKAAEHTEEKQDQGKDHCQERKSRRTGPASILHGLLPFRLLTTWPASAAPAHGGWPCCPWAG